jgi:hypothetical protein
MTVELILAARGIVVSYETIHARSLRFGRLFPAPFKRRRARLGDKWFLLRCSFPSRANCDRIRFLCRASLLIFDEIGYLRVGASAGNLFFQLIKAGHERGAVILIGNGGFSEWGDLVGDPRPCRGPAGRLLHHAFVLHIEGAS